MQGDQVTVPTGFSVNQSANVSAVYPPSSYPGTYTVAIDTVPSVDATVMDTLLGSGNWPVYDPNAVHWTTGAVVGYWHYEIPVTPGFLFTRPATTTITGQSVDDWNYQGFEFDTYDVNNIGVTGPWAFHEDTNPEPSPFLQHNTYNLQAGKKYKASFNRAPNQALTGVVQALGDNLALHDFVLESGNIYSTIFDINTGGYPFSIYQQQGDQVLIKDVSLRGNLHGRGNSRLEYISNWHKRRLLLPNSGLSPTGPGYIEFDDAPVGSGIEQFLSKNYIIGTSFTVSFEISNYHPAYEPELIMYMYNKDGHGFEYVIDTNAGPSYSIQGVISNATTSQTYATTAGGATAPNGQPLGTYGVFGFLE